MKPTTRHAAIALRPLTVAVRTLRRHQPLTILGWHRVDGLGGGVSTRLHIFEHQLDHLQQWGAAVLPLRDALAMLSAGRLPERAVCLTFDDGYSSVIETAWPLLRERDYSAIMFVCTEYLDGKQHFRWDPRGPDDPRAQLVDAQAVRDAHAGGMVIGSHTATHRWLPRLSDDAMRDELTRSREDLEQLLSEPVDSLAYPMGGWSRRVRATALQAGYTAAVTTDRGLNNRRQDRLLLRRSIVSDSVEDFRLMLDGAYNWLRPIDRWRIRNGPAW